MGKAKSLLYAIENNRNYEGKIDFQEISYLELLSFLSVFSEDPKRIVAKLLLNESDFLDKHPIFREFLEFMANEYSESATGEHYKIINDRYFSFAKGEYSLKIKDILQLSILKSLGVNEQSINIYQNAGLADYIETDKSPNRLIMKLQWKMIDDLKAKITELEAGKPSQSDTPANDDKELSNVELTNLKKAVIAENNRQIATVLKDLDYQKLLSKDDLLQVIPPLSE